MDTYIKDTPIWVDKILQIEVNHRVLGGNDEPANWQSQGLANRTAFLKMKIDELGGDKVNQSDYDLAIKALQEKDNDFAAAIKRLQEKDKALDDELIALKKSLTASVPVGYITQGISPTLYSDRFLFMRGDWIYRVDFPQLFDFLYIKCGYPLDAQGRVQIPDARALVFRDRNLGRFGDVTEIGLGTFQSDAIQKISGHINSLYSSKSSGLVNSGGFVFEDLQAGYVTRGSREGIEVNFSFDSSRVARTAFENRVKAMGVNSQIFIGWDFNDKEAA